MNTGSLLEVAGGATPQRQLWTPQLLLPGSGPPVQPVLGAPGFTAGQWWRMNAPGLDSLIVAQFVLEWGNPIGNAGSGAPFYGLTLPTPFDRTAMSSADVGDRAIGSGHLSFVFGLQPKPVAFLYGDNTTGFPTDQMAFATIGEHSHAFTATVPSAGTSVVVAHNGPGTPDAVNLVPQSNPQTAGAVQWWVDTIGAANFTVHATGAAGAALTANLSFTATAHYLTTQTYIGPICPIGWPSPAARLWGTLVYPSLT